MLPLGLLSCAFNVQMFSNRNLDFFFRNVFVLCASALKWFCVVVEPPGDVFAAPQSSITPPFHSLCVAPSECWGAQGPLICLQLGAAALCRAGAAAAPHIPHPTNPLHPPTHTHSLTIRKEALQGRRFIVALEQPSEQSSLFFAKSASFPSANHQTSLFLLLPLFHSSLALPSSSLVNKYASFSRNTTHQICDKLSRPHFLLFLSS